MKIEMYQAPQSTCSQKVRITLAEKGLPEMNKDWIEHDIDLGKFEQLEPDYLKINPNGVVPTFVHDGTILIESSAILEYLEEIIPAVEFGGSFVHPAAKAAYGVDLTYRF